MAGTYSVGQINAYIKNMFSQDFLLTRVSVTGEISNCKYHSSGHIYFSLKDETGSLRCVLFAGNRYGLSFRLENGQKVIVSGNIGVYERDGTYQLYARSIQRDGIGALYERFEQLKAELAEMGMFSPEYKKPIPAYPRTLGVVTAPTGAAVRDIIQIAKRRHPGIRILLYPAKVQGEGAAVSVAQGILALNDRNVDVIIVGRGGGSMEDLWAFNEEIVARAIFESRIPVISAVGHETDFVISDFVADLRAPTPSAAVELAVPDMVQMRHDLAMRRGRLYQGMMQSIARSRQHCEQTALRLRGSSPSSRLNESRYRSSRAADRLEAAMNHILQERKSALLLYAGKLDACSPLKKLASGYAYVSDAQRRHVTDAKMAKAAGKLHLWFSDGSVPVEVIPEENGTAGSLCTNFIGAAAGTSPMGTCACGINT